MGNGFRLIPAHSVITLAEELAAQIARRDNPLRPETVLVMNYAQRVWLRRFLAARLGISANLRFVSPESFLENLVADTRSRIFERDALAWRIFETLKKIHAPDAGTPPELRFFDENLREENVLLLAYELGDLFWRYQSFRPKMIRDWTKNAPPPALDDADFLFEYARQKNLWQALDFGNSEPPALAWTRLLKSAIPPEKIPPRIFAFAPSALPRLHLELLEKLAETAEVFLYYHHLSHDLWTESATEKTRLRERIRKTDTLRALPPESGNELLTAWGKAARPLAAHFIDTGLLDADSSRDAPPERDSLLHALQREIRDNSPAPEVFVPEKNDRSLRIAVAPSPLREMEILRDALLADFAENPELKPRDVLVMFPDVAAYTPFIRAAFENSGLPFSVADRDGTELFPVAAAFLEILRLADGEFRLDEILALLDRESICRALEISDEESAALRKILAESGIRWGIDTEFRRKIIFETEPPNEAMRERAELFAQNNSWKFGLRRLALGYMLGNATDAENTAALGSLPVPGIAEAAPLAFGKITRLLNGLAELNRAFASRETRRVPEWCDFLKTLLADDLLNTDTDDAALLRSALEAVKNAANNGAKTGVPAACTLASLRIALNRYDWSDANKNNGMLRGKITFCRMQPMRNIPAKIICLAGLNDGAFPRPSARGARDLTAFPAADFPEENTQWDRTKRDDDCLLFLESILAARDALRLSYVGRNANDGQPVPPCVPLAKLRDFVLQIVSEKNDTPGVPAFETLHRLHGFSPEYFSKNTATSEKFFSFSRTDYTTLCGENAELALARSKLDLPGVPEEISSTDLARFLKSPASYICRKIFGIADVPGKDAAENDDPPAQASTLDAARFHREFIEKILAGKEASVAFPDAETALKNFHAREIAAGNYSALSESGAIERGLAEKIKDFSAIEENLPGKLERVPEGSVPAIVFSLPKTPVKTEPVLRVAPDFQNLFRDVSGTLILPMFGRKRFDWRAAAESFVAAQMLSAAFPKTAFNVVYFAYGEKKCVRITETSLAACNLSAQDLVAFFAENLETPPLLFEKIPLVDPEKTTEDDFVRQAQLAWKTAPRDATEIFIFGEDAEISREENLRKIAFPLVRSVCEAFVPEK